MAAADAEERLVGRGAEIQRGGGAPVGNDVVVLERHHHDRLRDRVEPGRPAAHGEGAGRQPVLAVELLDVAAVGEPGEGDVVVAPALERGEVIEELVVPGAVDHRDQLGEDERGPEHVEAGLHERPGDVAEGVRQGVEIEPRGGGPAGEQTALMEVDGRGDQHQAGDLVGAGGRVNRRQRAAQAVAEQVHAAARAPARRDPDRAAEVAIDDVVPGEVAILVARRAPVDHEDVVTVLDQELDEAAARAEVEDVVAVDERGDQQHRRREVCAPAVMQQPPLVLGVHHVGGREADLGQPAGGAAHQIQRSLAEPPWPHE